MSHSHPVSTAVWHFAAILLWCAVASPARNGKSPADSNSLGSIDTIMLIESVYALRFDFTRGNYLGTYKRTWLTLDPWSRAYA